MPVTTMATAADLKIRARTSKGAPMEKAALVSSLGALDVWLIVFGVFVAIGVVGESVVGFLHWRRGNELQAVQESENLALQRDIGRLATDAETAKAQIAMANAREAIARREQEELKAVVAWRTIPDPSRIGLVGLLSNTRGSVAIAYVQNDPEAQNFAFEISHFFTLINGRTPGSWRFVPDPRMFSDIVVYGLFIFGRNAEVVKSIRDAFTAVGIQYSTDPVPASRPTIGALTFGVPTVDTDAVIMVGSKRPPF